MIPRGSQETRGLVRVADGDLGVDLPAVSKLEGAHCLTFRPGRVEARPYWRQTFVETWGTRDQR